MSDHEIWETMTLDLHDQSIIWKGSQLGIFILHCGIGVLSHLLKLSNFLGSLQYAAALTSSDIYLRKQFQSVFSAMKMGTEGNDVYTALFNHGVFSIPCSHTV